MADTVKQRITSQRRVILEELRKSVFHPTAAELYQVVRRRLPRISLGTVYRNLDLLARSGMARKLATGTGQSRFDANLEAHYHVRCIRCGRMDDVFSLPELILDDEVAQETGYEIQGHELQFVGICPACQQKSDMK